MKDLTIFIKDEFIKKALFEESLYIDNEKDAYNTAVKINSGKYINIIFENSILKNNFLDIITTMRPDSNIINCNCSIDNFNNININNLSGLLIFNNVKNCKHKEIIETIKNYKGILIC